MRRMEAATRRCTWRRQTVTRVRLSCTTSCTRAHSRAAEADVVQFLLTCMRQDAVNTANEQGNTPLHWAALTGKTAVVELLLGHGADPMLKNKSGRTPLDEAMQGNHDATCELISRSPKFHVPESEGVDPPDGDDEPEFEEGEQANDDGTASAAT